MDRSCRYPCFLGHRQRLARAPREPTAIRLVVFDMDGVLLDSPSSWRHIHNHFHTTNDESVEAYLRGDIDDAEFIRRDVSLWRDDGKLVTMARIEEILADIPLMPGAQECIDALTQAGVTTAIVSAGLSLLADRTAAQLGIPYVQANSIKTDRFGRLTGEGDVQVRLTRKDENVRTLAATLGIPLSACAAVGNSCFDIPMFEVSGLGIAFDPEDDCVRKAADRVVEEKDLRCVLAEIIQCC